MGDAVWPRKARSTRESWSSEWLMVAGERDGEGEGEGESGGKRAQLKGRRRESVRREEARGATKQASRATQAPGPPPHFLPPSPLVPRVSCLRPLIQASPLATCPRAPPPAQRQAQRLQDTGLRRGKSAQGGREVTSRGCDCESLPRAVVIENTFEADSPHDVVGWQLATPAQRHPRQ